jgi:hydrogenase maturation protein HypF
MTERKRIRVNGIVQGVGFRPFVYRLASRLGLTGFVRNTSEGVDIEVQGDIKTLKRFLKFLTQKRPPAATIDKLSIQTIPGNRDKWFVIRKSAQREGFTHIAPDIATCKDCCDELYNPADRRYMYPFVNCTNCGPRYSIIQRTPYDRARTTMKAFRMCEDCVREFEDIMDRRFHAQPDCCAICGPSFVLLDTKRRIINAQNPIKATGRLLQQGAIIAIKGIGGFHIACDATNTRAVGRLRRRKKRPTKPFAIMCNLKDARAVAHVSDEEAEYLRLPRSSSLRKRVL